MHLPQWVRPAARRPEEQQTGQENPPQEPKTTSLFRNQSGPGQTAPGVTHLCGSASLTNLGLVCGADLGLLTATDKKESMNLPDPAGTDPDHRVFTGRRMGPRGNRPPRPPGGTVPSLDRKNSPS